MKYETREKLAYSRIGKVIATVIRAVAFRDSRIHWIQQAMADADFSKVRRTK